MQAHCRWSAAVSAAVVAASRAATPGAGGEDAARPAGGTPALHLQCGAMSVPSSPAAPRGSAIAWGARGYTEVLDPREVAKVIVEAAFAPVRVSTLVIGRT